jgi:hypothetical protein
MGENSTASRRESDRISAADEKAPVPTASSFKAPDAASH